MSPPSKFPALPPAPIQQLQADFLDTADIQLWVKREDLIDSQLGGNKWHKLKYNLQAASEQGHDCLLTFGGAYSNHIYATAAAGKRFGFNTIGVIRGEAQPVLNPTLQFAHDCNMHLHYLDRARYRDKNSAALLSELKQRYGRFYQIPEGGSNMLGVQGCCQMINDIQQAFDIFCCACGTGATLAGISLGLKSHQLAIGYAALKNAEFLNRDVAQLRATLANRPGLNWKIETDYHFGGYAKINAELISFMADFENQFGFALDAVYTAKMFYGLFAQIKQGQFRRGSVIMALHSGGLQGNAGLLNTGV